MQSIIDMGHKFPSKCRWFLVLLTYSKNVPIHRVYRSENITITLRPSSETPLRVATRYYSVSTRKRKGKSNTTNTKPTPVDMALSWSTPYFILKTYIPNIHVTLILFSRPSRDREGPNIYQALAVSVIAE